MYVDVIACNTHSFIESFEVSHFLCFVKLHTIILRLNLHLTTSNFSSHVTQTRYVDDWNLNQNQVWEWKYECMKSNKLLFVVLTGSKGRTISSLIPYFSLKAYRK